MSLQLPRVSVLMPVRRPEPGLFRAAVRSVLGQTLRDLELVVVEAPAPGIARSLLAGVDDPRLRLEEVADPTTLVDQLNRGLELCRAPTVARMDADDLCHPERLERQLALLDDDPQLHVVGCQAEVVDQDGALLGHAAYPVDHEAIIDALTRYNAICHPGVLFRREAVMNDGGYRYFEGAEDYELWCRMARRGRRFANHPDILLRYRFHPASVKATRVRATLRSTLRTKRLHWAGRMSFGARLRFWIERSALRIPPRLVLRCFARYRYQRRISAAGANGATRFEGSGSSCET